MKRGNTLSFQELLRVTFSISFPAVNKYSVATLAGPVKANNMIFFSVGKFMANATTKPPPANRAGRGPTMEN